MTSNELKQIKDNVGHLIAMNSFLSTSLDYDLAETWAGSGEGRPKFESVIFEIIIDECKFKNVPIIFANITSKSNFEEEREVLLAMGTTLHIESVKLEGNIWKICLHAYPFDDALCSNLETVFPKLRSYLASIDDCAQLMIASILLEMGNFEKAKQIYQQTSSCKNPFTNTYRSLLKGYIDLYQIAGTQRSIQSTEIKEQLCKIKESLQQMKQLISSDNHSSSNVLEMQMKKHDLIMEQFFSSDLNISDALRLLGPLFSQIMRQRELFPFSNEMVLDDSSIRNPTELIDATSQDNETFGLMNSEEIQYVIDQNLVKNDPRRIGLLIMMASNATEKNKYDQAIGYLRNALLIPCNDENHARVYNQLAKVYEKQKNWPAALECYENIIGMPQLSETSSTLPLAHLSAANIYEKIQDDHNAIVHYKRGVQLYCQHESPQHPIVSTHKIVIGLKFEKLGDMDAALKTFEEVIDLGRSEDVKVAYKHISMIYISREDYDMAYYNSIESLKISQREIPPDIDFIIEIHLLLLRIEFLRNHFDEGCVHMKEAVVMSENHECTEATRKEIQSILKIFSDPQCRARSHNSN
jgi:tetratricopeptide (TPR) repeat protein